jgi:hypothetical protein
MSYVASQLSPHMGTHTREVFVHAESEGAWNSPPWLPWNDRRGKNAAKPFADQGELSSPALVNWGTVLGLALTVSVGAAFWTGVGLVVARLWK